MTDGDQPAGNGGRAPRNVDRLLVDLGEDVRALRRRIDGKLTPDLQEVGGLVAEAMPRLADIECNAADIAGRLSAVEKKLETPEIQNPPINWLTLPAETAELVWDGLATWVDEVLGGLYEISRAQLPDCWALHRPAVVQLTALWTGHRGSFAKTAHHAQALEFNTRWVDAVLERVHRAIPERRCRPIAGAPGEHLVDKIEAEQRQSREQRMLARSSELRHRIGEPPTTFGPPPAATGPGTYPPAPAALPEPEPEPATMTVAGDEVITRSYWQGYFEQAKGADLAARREREAAEAKGRTDDAPF